MTELAICSWGMFVALKAHYIAEEYISPKVLRNQNHHQADKANTILERLADLIPQHGIRTVCLTFYNLFNTIAKASATD